MTPPTETQRSRFPSPHSAAFLSPELSTQVQMASSCPRAGVCAGVCASVCDMCASGFACAHVSVHACLSVYMDAHVCVLSAQVCVYVCPACTSV